MVRIAAMLEALNSRPVSENSPIVRMTSWKVAMIAPMANCHSNRNQM